MLGVVALRRDRYEERLRASTHRSIKDIIKFAVFRLSQLIEDHQGRVEAVLCTGLCRDRPIERAVGVTGQRLRRRDHPHKRLELRISIDDLPGHLEDLGRLLAVVRRGIDFSVLDRLGPDQVREHESRNQRRLAVLACDREDGPTHEPALGHPIMRLVDVSDEPLLPLAQLERSALPLTARDN